LYASSRASHNNRRFRYGAGAFSMRLSYGRETVANTFITDGAIVQNRVVTQLCRRACTS